MSWDVSPGASGGYRVYFGTAPRSYGQPLGQGSLAVTNGLALFGFTSGYTYYFAVTAIDAAGHESAYSNEVSKTFP